MIISLSSSDDDSLTLFFLTLNLPASNSVRYGLHSFFRAFFPSIIYCVFSTLHIYLTFSPVG